MSERVDIKHLAVEKEPEKKYPFMPTRDVTPEQKRGLEEAVPTWVKAQEWQDLASLAFAAQLAGMSPILSDHMKESIQNKAALLSIQKNWVAYAELLSYEKLLGWNPRIYPKERKVLEGLGSGAIDEFPLLSVSLKILGIKGEPDPEMLQRLQIGARENIEKEQWYWMAIRARFARILGGRIEIGEREIEGMRDLRLEYSGNGSWGNFAQLVFAESVMFADRVVIPPGGGLQLFWDEKEELPSPSLPEQRTF